MNSIAAKVQQEYIVTSASSLLTSLACYLLPDRACSRDSPSFASGTAPYFDASCAVVSLVSTSLACSDRTVPQLCPLQLLTHTYMYTTDLITMHAATHYFGLLGWRTFE